jgi:hypothetical protein
VFLQLACLDGLLCQSKFQHLSPQPFLTTPRSPWWLLSKGKEARAAKSLKQLGYTTDDVEKRMAAIVLTLEEIRRETEGVSWLECVKKSNLRRTMISIMPLTIQALSGICTSSRIIYPWPC